MDQYCRDGTGGCRAGAVGAAPGPRPSAQRDTEGPGSVQGAEHSHAGEGLSSRGTGRQGWGRLPRGPLHGRQVGELFIAQTELLID